MPGSRQRIVARISTGARSPRQLRKHCPMAMFDHIQIKVDDLESSRAFYEAVLGTLGYKVVFEAKAVVVGFGNNPHDMFEVRQAGPDAPVSKSAHIAFAAQSEDAVHAFHAVALAQGAKDNGMPGPRPHYEQGYFAAFVIDPNGHNLEAVYKKT
jgi:catechol 2,3-dioxygenase-like lactoylglutathione lyase family enzyme